MNKSYPGCLIAAGILSLMLPLSGQIYAASELSYEKNMPMSIPPAELSLQTVVAEPWFEVTKDNHILEGVIFDANGNLLFCDVTGKKILRLSPDKKLTTVVKIKDFMPGGLAFHPDGRLFFAATSDFKQGIIGAIDLKTGKIEDIIPASAGYIPNDLVFDQNGGFYFTDFKGTATEPKGGIFYMAPDLKTIRHVLPAMSLANGIALSPDGKKLWATEYGKNKLHRMELAEPAVIAPICSYAPYHFTGCAPDSMRADSDGNIYVAMMPQGRALVFNDNGVPVGQILLPDRDNGKNLRSTSLAIAPGKKDLFIVTSDNDGAGIFKAKALANGQ